MLIYSPQPEAEFAAIIGGLSEEEFVLLEGHLRSVTPTIRFLKEREKGKHPRIPQYTLKVYRQHRDLALPIINEIMEGIYPILPRIEEADAEVAVLVRQFTRATQAEDPGAVRLMQRYLLQSTQYLLERLLMRAKIAWALDLWLDGIGVQQLELVRPQEVTILGYIWIGTTQTTEPFEAHLRADLSRPGLDLFAARFGDYSRLASTGVIRRDVMESYHLGETAYHVYVGRTVPAKDGQVVDWALEVVKQ